jgi:hypothetical protein
MRTGRSFLLLAMSVVLLLAGSLAPAAATTFGQPDEGEHPHVGLIYFEQDGGIYRCTGTLIDPKVVLTAAHCLTGAEPNTRTWVTFQERVDIPSEALALPSAAFGDWLDANEDFISGVAHPHPKYDGFASFPAIYDIGAVVFAEPVTGIKVAELPSAGFLERLRPRDRAGFTVAGYGLQGFINPFFSAERDRYKGQVRFIEVNSTFTAKGQASAKFSNNPGKGNGSGGSCFGDSGGPVFYGEAVVAVVSWGITPCIGVDYQYRVDTADSLGFLADVLAGVRGE